MQSLASLSKDARCSQPHRNGARENFVVVLAHMVALWRTLLGQFRPRRCGRRKRESFCKRSRHRGFVFSDTKDIGGCASLHRLGAPLHGFL